MATATEDPQQTGGGEQEPRRSPFASRWWIAAAIVVGLIGALLLWLVLLPPYSPKRTAPTGPLPHPATGPQFPATASACGLPGGDQIPPAVTPPTTWRLVGTMAAPIDPAIGPATTRDGVGACYAPTPLGALYAAANFLAATSTPTLRLAAAQLLCAPGPGRDAALADLAAGDLGSTDTGIQLAGFVVVGYDPGVSASLDLAVSTGRGGWAHFPLALSWDPSAGDWRVQLPVTGTPFAGAQVLPTLGGYTAWSGA